MKTPFASSEMSQVSIPPGEQLQTNISIIFGNTGWLTQEIPQKTTQKQPDECGNVDLRVAFNVENAKETIP